MGSSKSDKWYKRAQEYQRLLQTKGRKEAGAYLERFVDNLDPFMAAIWEAELDDAAEGVDDYRPKPSKLAVAMRAIQIQQRAAQSKGTITRAQIMRAMYPEDEEEL